MDCPSFKLDRQFKNSILISIESEWYWPVLFVNSHLLNRFERKLENFSFGWRAVSESLFDSIDIDHKSIGKMDNFLAINNNLHDQLVKLVNFYQFELREKLVKLKVNLTTEFNKFNLTTMTSLSMAKQLYNLPQEMHDRYNKFCLLTKQYQLGLSKLLNELERVKKLSFSCSKLPIDRDSLLIEMEKDKFDYCCQFSDEI